MSVSSCLVPFLMRQIVLFQKSMTFCRSIYVKKVMKLLAFIFEQPSYIVYVQVTIIKTYLLTYLPAYLLTYLLT